MGWGSGQLFLFWESGGLEHNIQLTPRQKKILLKPGCRLWNNCEGEGGGVIAYFVLFLKD